MPKVDEHTTAVNGTEYDGDVRTRNDVRLGQLHVGIVGHGVNALQHDASIANETRRATATKNIR